MAMHALVDEKRYTPDVRHRWSNFRHGVDLGVQKFAERAAQVADFALDMGQWRSYDESLVRHAEMEAPKNIFDIFESMTPHESAPFIDHERTRDM